MLNTHIVAFLFLFLLTFCIYVHTHCNLSIPMAFSRELALKRLSQAMLTLLYITSCKLFWLNKLSQFQFPGRRRVYCGSCGGVTQCAGGRIVAGGSGGGDAGLDRGGSGTHIQDLLHQTRGIPSRIPLQVCHSLSCYTLDPISPTLTPLQELKL